MMMKLLTIPLPHETLPPPFDKIASQVLLEDVENADAYLMAAIVVFTTLAFIQLKAFARPHPVPLKQLPKRPTLSVLFKPDDATPTNAKTAQSAAHNNNNNKARTSSSPQSTRTKRGTLSEVTVEGVESVKENLFRSMEGSSVKKRSVVVEDVPLEELELPLAGEEELSSESYPTRPVESPVLNATDLPDSFAPLLSSSQVELLLDQLTADLIHSFRVEASIRMREGHHEIPLDKNNSRPQLQLIVPKSGCKLSATVMVGSDGFTPEEDLDVTCKTSTRSKPMVKHAGVVLDPPLPLSNVAPTLIHFPTLFEDKFVPKLRRIQIIRIFFDLIISFSSLLEKCLWIIESQCHIHLSSVKVAPIYKGRSSVTKEDDDAKRIDDKNDSYSPDWRLALSFSGHVLLFGYIPVPFINVSLPTFIIPQPHALLDYLLTPQPLASARLRRENIAESRIALALLHTAESWNVQMSCVATPPAVGVDITLPGGVAVAVEMVLGRDTKPSTSVANNSSPRPTDDHASINSMSSWSTRVEQSESQGVRANRGVAAVDNFDANNMIPWFLEFAAKGSISSEKLSFHIMKMAAKHEEVSNGQTTVNQLGARGSFAIWKLHPGHVNESSDSLPLRKPTPMRTRMSTAAHPHLQTEDSPTVTSILLFPHESHSFHDDLRMLQYDYVFDVYENSKVDAITVSYGATHPMLNGGTMVTTILDSIYAYGSISAREKAVLDPKEMHRKRNILRHLPATDFHFGIQNIYIPVESESYSDDGQTLFLPELERGRMRVHLIGGIDKSPEDYSLASNSTPQPVESLADGIKIIADYEAPSMHLRSEGLMKEFPELDIFDGVKLKTNLHGLMSGSVRAHLRPQHFSGALSTLGPNVFNPLEAYEIDFSGSSWSMKMKEFTISIGHRRIIFPSESKFVINVIESVVDMGFEGKTLCDMGWDFQGLSPILQVTRLGQTPEDATPENKQQVSILIAPLRQGRISFRVSSVGGISINKAATSREDKEGLYDWKFVNALVSPDEESAGRILEVLHDKRTMDKFLQVIKLINEDLHKISKRALEILWRAKEILEREGISDPKHAIPMYKMSRLICLFLTASTDNVDEIFPVVKRVILGEGLDVVKVKELLRQNIQYYDEWAPEIDRAVRWLAVSVGPMSSPHFVEEEVPPLVEIPRHAEKFGDILSASQLYSTLSDKAHLPLDPVFSCLVGQVAPYLTFKQVEFILQARDSTDWQPSDLRRLRYVYSIKRKVLEIAESYGGLSFLPQSFFLSVFLGEATRSSHRAPTMHNNKRRRRLQLQSPSGESRPSAKTPDSDGKQKSHQYSVLGRLRKQRVESHTRLEHVPESPEYDQQARTTPAERIAANSHDDWNQIPQTLRLVSSIKSSVPQGEIIELGDSLLGPQDVATLLQAGLTSVMKSSTVVQLNQRMLLDLICSQPRSFAVAVLAEIGSPSGQGSPRNLTSALMALLELDQTSFKSNHQIDMHALLESWLPGLRVPRREDYMAGGRWARQSYYEAIFSVSKSILDDAETYMAMKGHVQRVRHQKESDPLAVSKCEVAKDDDHEAMEAEDHNRSRERAVSAAEKATACIKKADEAGLKVIDSLVHNEKETKQSPEYRMAISLYQDAFKECRNVLDLDKYAFQLDWFRSFYKRNYDALMILSLFENIRDNIDHSRKWLNALRIGAKKSSSSIVQIKTTISQSSSGEWEDVDDVFLSPERHGEQEVVDAILDALLYEDRAREELRSDPLIRLLIPNPPGKYEFAVVTAMGVVTEGKTGRELQDAFDRLYKQRGVTVIRSDTATARSFEYNASRIEEAIETAVQLKKPYGLLGYSQGCANALMAESLLRSGSPKQQRCLERANGGLVCRQLVFSAANGSFHGPAMERKVQRLIVMCEEFFKYQQGYVSRALSSFILDALNTFLDSSHFHKAMGGAQSFLPDGCRALWREAQHLDDVPTCSMRGVLEPHTTPESLEMISHLLTKQSGSALHDSQVHVFDAVGYPVYFHNRNGRMLKKCAIGEGTVQRTHHWSPLSDEVEFVRTAKDQDMASFDCAKDRHVFPWVEVNARFGFIKYQDSPLGSEPKNRQELHPTKVVQMKAEVEAVFSIPSTQQEECSTRVEEPEQNP